tara:strand:+ start:20120 stop:20488 length:369 start_codon:yes stop_codon:yes gene_type:complete
MPAGVYDFHVEQGVANKFSIEYRASDGTAKDLTGYSGRGQVKLKMSDSQPLAEFEVTITDPLLGKLDVALPAAALKGHTFKASDYKDKVKGVYDIELYKDTSDEETIRILNGNIFISPEVTK